MYPEREGSCCYKNAGDFPILGHRQGSLQSVENLTRFMPVLGTRFDKWSRRSITIRDSMLNNWPSGRILLGCVRFPFSSSGRITPEAYASSDTIMSHEVAETLTNVPPGPFHEIKCACSISLFPWSKWSYIFDPYYSCRSANFNCTFCTFTWCTKALDFSTKTGGIEKGFQGRKSFSSTHISWPLFHYTPWEHGLHTVEPTKSNMGSETCPA